MKIWYEAVCDEHKEFCTIMVDSPLGTVPYMTEELNLQLKEWMMKHSWCGLRIICEDKDMDFLVDNDYKRVNKK